MGDCCGGRRLAAGARSLATGEGATGAWLPGLALALTAGARMASSSELVDLLSPGRGAPDPNTYMPPPRLSPRAYSRSWLAALMLTGSCAAACCFRAAKAWSLGFPSTMSGVGRSGVAGAVPVYSSPPYDAVHHVVPSGFWPCTRLSPPRSNGFMMIENGVVHLFSERTSSEILRKSPSSLESNCRRRLLRRLLAAAAASLASLALLGSHPAPLACLAASTARSAARVASRISAPIRTWSPSWLVSPVPYPAWCSSRRAIRRVSSSTVNILKARPRSRGSLVSSVV